MDEPPLKTSSITFSCPRFDVGFFSPTISCQIITFCRFYDCTKLGIQHAKKHENKNTGPYGNRYFKKQQNAKNGKSVL